jgi:hypothetical protein
MVAELLTPVEVTLDDLVPVMSGADLIDVSIVYTTRYTDATQATVATRQNTISAFGLMTQEQRDYITTLAVDLKQALHLAIVGE